ncbi:MAG: 1-(5-phosphoribosyl)-5-[(5-phosphoribosylamino)methylideneamino]imidazole-4-carboxamide isomerase [Verrucomicrobiota bacterium]
MFTIYPAIDLKGGRCVRLLHGRADKETVYFEDPMEAADMWMEQGAEWLHVVDLDGAFTGELTHLDLIRRIAALGMKVEMGGGLRDEESISRALEAGASRAVVGTSAVEKPDFPRKIVEAFGSDAVAIGLDAKDGKLSLQGWVKDSGIETVEFGRRLQGDGITTVIHTDISTDGALTGPNLLRQAELCESCPDLSVIASGGVASLADVQALNELSHTHKNLTGVIVGRAIYEDRVSVKEMIDTVSAKE